MNHYPLTNEQREILYHDLATIMEHLGDITNLLSASCGDKDPQVVRAEEAQGAVQRLLWALERQTQSANAAGSAQDVGNG